MNEDMLVKLIADGELSHGAIAQRVGVSRHTVWRIANGISRPDLQLKIAAAVEGYRQAAIRLAARWMKPLLEKQIEVALESDGETARKCREFLIKTFMLAVPDQAAKTQEKPPPEPEDQKPLNPTAVTKIMHDLSPELIGEICTELFGSDYKSQDPYQEQQGTPTVPSPDNRSP
jgi:hypothetical protein